MGIPISNLNSHLGRVISDIPVTVYRNKGSFQGVRSTPSITETVVLGGLDQKIEYTIFANRNDINPPAAIGEIWTVDQIKMRVLGIKTSPDGNLLSFQMGFSRT